MAGRKTNLPAIDYIISNNSSVGIGWVTVTNSSYALLRLPGLTSQVSAMVV